MAIEHDGTPNIVCPYCGYEDRDSWEFGEDYGEMDCPECERAFKVNKNVSVDFTTEKIPKLKPCPKCGCDSIERFERIIDCVVEYGCQCAECGKESPTKVSEKESLEAWGIVEEDHGQEK